jgi:hypothetical protein
MDGSLARVAMGDGQHLLGMAAERVALHLLLFSADRARQHPPHEALQCTHQSRCAANGTKCHPAVPGWHSDGPPK